MTTMEWELGNVQTNAKGIRSAPLTNSDGSPVILQLTDVHNPLKAPFGSSAFNDPTAIRHNICFRCDQSLEDKIKQIDDYMCQYIETHAARLFKNKSVNYKPLLLTKEDYPSLIRCKINISGSKACRFWTHQFARCDMPEDLRNCGLVPRVHFKSLWIMGSEAGISVEVTDLLCDQTEETCPFNNDIKNSCLSNT